MKAHGLSFAVRRGLVERSTALRRTTQALDFLVFNRELVVVGDFFIHVDRLLRINNNLFQTFNCDDLGIAIGLEEEK